MRQPIALIVVAAVHAGCASHVMLTSGPPRDAPFTERRAYYEAHKPTNVAQAVPPRPLFATIFDPIPQPLRLANGQAVEYPEDLLPALDPTSPAAIAASGSESARSTSFMLSAAGLSVSVVSVATTAIGMGYAFTADSGREGGLIVALVGVGGSFVGTIVYLIGGFFSRSEKLQRDTAFNEYDRSLLGTLGIRDKSTTRVIVDDVQSKPPPPMPSSDPVD